MPQVTARLPEALLDRLDDAAHTLQQSRADVVRQAIASYLDDFEDVTTAVAALQNPNDPGLNWNDVRCDLLGQV